MSNLTKYSQTLVYELLAVMPSRYQQRSLAALIGLFLQASGQSIPQHSELVSASAISRFLNQYAWSTQGVIRPDDLALAWLS